jgi:hypothetical protein
VQADPHGILYWWKKNHFCYCMYMGLMILGKGKMFFTLEEAMKV